MMNNIIWVSIQVGASNAMIKNPLQIGDQS